MPAEAATLSVPMAAGETAGWRRDMAMGISGQDRAGNGPAYHLPVLAPEAVEQMAVRQDGVYLDATVGEGGHALAVLDASDPSGRVLGIELDPRSLAYAARRLESYGSRFVPIRGNYRDMVALALAAGVDRVDGVLMDLGFSSRQVQEAGYGMSFRTDEPLDMRYDPEEALTADRIVNAYAEADLARIIFQFGQEPRARTVARGIVRGRPIGSTAQLAGLVARTLGPRRWRRIHPATRTFQALRIAVNGELDNLEEGLAAAVRLLAPGGRLVIISYHSLEDRLAKTFLARQSAACICPLEAQACVCGRRPALRLVTRRVVKASATEVQRNPRSRSARMRVAQRL